MITHPTVTAYLSPEDLQRWRTWAARDSAMNLAPDHYNREEMEEHFRQRQKLFQEFTDRYELLDTPHLVISSTKGALYYDDED
jgi:hypothetical protein